MTKEYDNDRNKSFICDSTAAQKSTEYVNTDEKLTQEKDTIVTTRYDIQLRTNIKYKKV